MDSDKQYWLKKKARVQEEIDRARAELEQAQAQGDEKQADLCEIRLQSLFEEGIYYDANLLGVDYNDDDITIVGRGDADKIPFENPKTGEIVDPDTGETYTLADALEAWATEGEHPRGITDLSGHIYLMEESADEGTSAHETVHREQTYEKEPGDGFTKQDEIEAYRVGDGAREWIKEYNQASDDKSPEEEQDDADSDEARELEHTRLKEEVHAELDRIKRESAPENAGLCAMESEAGADSSAEDADVSAATNVEPWGDASDAGDLASDLAESLEDVGYSKDEVHEMLEDLEVHPDRSEFYMGLAGMDLPDRSAVSNGEEEAAEDALPEDDFDREVAGQVVDAVEAGDKLDGELRGGWGNAAAGLKEELAEQEDASVEEALHAVAGPAGAAEDDWGEDDLEELREELGDFSDKELEEYTSLLQDDGATAEEPWPVEDLTEPASLRDEEPDEAALYDLAAGEPAPEADLGHDYAAAVYDGLADDLPDGTQEPAAGAEGSAPGGWDDWNDFDNWDQWDQFENWDQWDQFENWDQWDQFNNWDQWDQFDNWNNWDQFDNWDNWSNGDY
jgi:hypothetical protein